MNFGHNSFQNVQLLQPGRRVERKTRSPRHDYYLQHRPYQIQPFMCAPVLPGETLKNMTLTGRVISDPLNFGPGNILPWWHEVFWFYVKARDLDLRDSFETMILEPSTTVGNITAADAPTFHGGGAVNYVRACLKRVTEEYFRDEGESWDAQSLDGLPMARAFKRGSTFVDSMAALSDPATDPNFHQNPQTGPDPFAEHLDAWNRMRAMRMVDLSFEDYLAMHGIGGQEAVEEHKPEILRYASNWTYPTNTVDPVTGDPSAAASWSVSERSDKDRFFTEPGFILGVTVVKAKLYMGNQRSAAVSMLENARAWLSHTMADRPEASLRQFGLADGPIKGQTEGYWLDIRDLFIHGDQFNNMGATAWAHAPAVPTAAGDYGYITSAMINGLFKTATVNKIRQDGVCNLSILGHPTTAMDHT